MAGMRGMNPRQMKQAMRKMGISNEALEDVVEVIIRTSGKEIRFESPAVNIMTVQGERTYQIMGEPVESAASGEEGVHVPKEDIDLVMSQTGCDEATARAALIECDGLPADAIIKIAMG
ncbi:MAG: Nascent polypeptide-associated complex protein [Thermoplasmatales archaeon]|nr:Nascent polypeptide-associated complex protein [Thermoplasmatales archaeon]